MPNRPTQPLTPPNGLTNPSNIRAAVTLSSLAVAVAVLWAVVTTLVLTDDDRADGLLHLGIALTSTATLGIIAWGCTAAATRSVRQMHTVHLVRANALAAGLGQVAAELEQISAKISADQWCEYDNVLAAATPHVEAPHSNGQVVSIGRARPRG